MHSINIYSIHTYLKYSVAAILGIIHLLELYRISSPHGKCWNLTSGSTSTKTKCNSLKVLNFTLCKSSGKLSCSLHIMFKTRLVSFPVLKLLHIKLKDHFHTKTHLHSVSLLGPAWKLGALCGPLAPAAPVTPAALPGPPLHPASSCPHRPWRFPAASPQGGPAFPAALSQPQLAPLLWESRSVTVTEAEFSGYFLGTWGAESYLTQVHKFLNWNCDSGVPTFNTLIPTAFLFS